MPLLFKFILGLAGLLSFVYVPSIRTYFYFGIAIYLTYLIFRNWRLIIRR